jgi:hypothetical protein
VGQPAGGSPLAGRSADTSRPSQFDVIHGICAADDGRIAAQAGDVGGGGDGGGAAAAAAAPGGMEPQLDPSAVAPAEAEMRVAEVGRRLDSLADSLSRKLERIAYALGIRNLAAVDNSGDDEARCRAKQGVGVGWANLAAAFKGSLPRPSDWPWLNEFTGGSSRSAGEPQAFRRRLAANRVEGDRQSD